MQVLTDFPERLVPGTHFYAGPQRRRLRLRSRRWHRQRLLVAFEGLQTREQAGELRNQLLLVRADDRPPLPAGEYYHHQLIGLKVVDEAGDVLGSLVEILQTGANDVYVVRSASGRELLLPAVDEVLRGIDLERGEIRVHLLPGLLDEGE